MAKSFNKGTTFVIWLIGMAALIHNFAAIVTAISIWGALGVAMLWAVFCIRQT